MVTVEQLRSKKRLILTAMVIGLLLFAVLKPQAFMDLWLTKDQQGQLLFNQGKYLQASKTYTDNRWQAFSAYGAQEYKTAATLYSQFNDKESLLAQANAIAHSREYIEARNFYQQILAKYPNFQAAQTNLAIVQAIIDEVNLMSESQRAEQGESSKELGDEPQTGDGAERKDAQVQEVEQLTSEQLLLDDNLNEMWLRQVQKNPERFLSQKFYMQLKAAQPSPAKAKGATDE